jgi:hypothetical protein
MEVVELLQCAKCNVNVIIKEKNMQLLQRTLCFNELREVHIFHARKWVIAQDLEPEFNVIVRDNMRK